MASVHLTFETSEQDRAICSHKLPLLCVINDLCIRCYKKVLHSRTPLASSVGWRRISTKGRSGLLSGCYI